MNKVSLRGVSLAACSALLLSTALPLSSHDPITTKLTWTQEISRILYRRCAGCHRPDGNAMSLVTYAEARPWAAAIREQVASRQMPPWGAVAGVGDFANDPSLTTPEIDMLIAWAEGGAPEGDPAYLPRRVPAALPPATTPPHLHSLRITRQTTITAPASVGALRPEHLADGGSLECWAILPGQRVERLLWLRDYRSQWTRDYILHDPIRLPAGTSVHVRGTGHSALRFMFN